MEATAAANVAASPMNNMSSLYVGDLHPDVTDEQLVQAFSEFQSLASVRVCRDTRNNDKSLGYGYLNFQSAQDAAQALKTKNHMKLNGKPVRLMWSKRDSDFRRNGIGNVFVKNLSESVDHEKLEDKFKEFGNILSCKVGTSEDGSSKGYGFVQFETEDAANSAIKMVNGADFHGKKIYVGPHVRKADRALPNPVDQYTNLYVKNLDVDITEEELREMFSKFGTISSPVISVDEHGSSKGFGFVNFVKPDDARRAVEAMNGLQLGSKVLYVGRAQKKSERERMLRQQFEEKRMEQIQKYKGSNVYVKNIDDSVTEDMLRELFSQCGTITSVKLMQDEKGISRGFGFVCFSTPEEASKAVNTFQCYMFHGKPLYSSIAQRKEERQAHLQMHYAQRLNGIVGQTSPPVIPGVYHPVYFPAPPSAIAPGPQRPGLMYQPSMGVRPGWRGNNFVPPAIPPFQPPRPHMMANIQRHPRPIRGRVNGHASSQGHAQSRDFSNSQRAVQAIYAPNGHFQDANNGTGVLSPIPSAVGRVGPGNTAQLSSLIATADPAQQKLIIGEHLFHLVEQRKPDLAAKITGMLLEMPNSELLLMLESPESLTAKVEEAVQVLKAAKTKASSQEGVRPFISAEVAVN
ncbi:unnamed protein product [Rhodiola kirilowii]